MCTCWRRVSSSEGECSGGFVYPCMCVKQFSIGAGQLLFSTPNIQELYLIIPPIAMALTLAPVPCLALQSLRHLMKAALHDAIKEQGSF